MIQFLKNMFGKNDRKFKAMHVSGARMSAHTFFTDISKEKQKSVFDKAMRGVVQDQQDIIERYNRKFGRVYD